MIINLAENLSSEQSTLMNLFFAAKHCSLRVNVASLNGAVPILQQAADITDGLHIDVEPKLLAGNVLVSPNYPMKIMSYPFFH